MKSTSQSCTILGKAVTTTMALAWAASLTLAVHGEFTPGSGGSIPDITPPQGVANQIPGLVVENNDRANYYFTSGTHPEIDVWFSPPSVYGATGYQLQRSPLSGSTWTNYLATSANSQDNFSFTPDGAYNYRLLVQGGAKNGYVSNVVSATPSAVDTRFSQWGLDESMMISGVIWPWVGRGMTASFTVNKLSDDSVVSGGLTYQWYRVNPLSGAMVAIPGATSLTYITTENDLGGYMLLCRASGNGTTVGGYAQVMSSTGILVPNNSYYSGLTANGFYLHLHKSVPSLEPADLKLSYWDNAVEKKIAITGVTASENNASFWIAASIPTGITSLTLSNVSDVWGLGAEIGSGHFMQSLQITVPTEGFAPEIAVERPAGTALTDATGSQALGKILVGKTTSALTFTIRNTGTANLTGLAITKGGTNPADFLVGGLSATNVAPGGTATFTVAFKPGAAGPRTCAIHIASNDADEHPFDITLTGSGIAPTPEIVVHEPKGQALADGRNMRKYGTVLIGSQGKSKVFIIKNTGTAALKNIVVRISGIQAEDFILTAPTKVRLLPGEFTTFRVTFKPKVKGIRNASLKIFSNDANENPFDIVVTGTGSAL